MPLNGHAVPASPTPQAASAMRLRSPSPARPLAVLCRAYPKLKQDARSVAAARCRKRHPNPTALSRGLDHPQSALSRGPIEKRRAKLPRRIVRMVTCVAAPILHRGTHVVSLFMIGGSASTV
jgi:hypothetical protein